MDRKDRRRIRQNFVRLFNREVVNRGARFAASVVLARALTVSDYGVVNVGIAAAGILLTATTLGLHDLGAREVAARPDGAAALLRRVLAARLLALGFVSACGLVA